MEWVFGFVLALFAGLAGWVLGRQRLQADLDRVVSERTELEKSAGELQLRLEMEQKNSAERISELKEFRERYEAAFKALSAEALQRNNEQFLTLAKESFLQLQTGAKGELEKRQQAIRELVNPIRESLQKVDEKMQGVEKARVAAYADLQSQIRNLLEAQLKLRTETSSLVHSLRAPSVRGRWGEMQLERTVEFAGMTERVDFIKQANVSDSEGQNYRPDMVVQLPGGKSIVIDAKAPLDAYLQAMECEDGNRRVELVKRHSKQIREHIKILASKQYWRSLETTPEFVVLFLPGEVFFSAALEQDPELIQEGAQSNVLLATPTTLIALLKAAAYGWRQEAIAAEAMEVSQLGRELYERLCTQTDYFTDVGKSLGKAVESYNRSLRSLETRVLVTARKFERFAEDSKKKLPDPGGAVDVRPLGE